PANVATVSLRTGGGVQANAGASISVPNLAITSTNAVLLDQSNDVGTLGIVVSGAGQSITYRDRSGLTIGSVDGVRGLTTSGGAISVVTTTNGAPGSLIVNSPVNAGAAPITLASVAPGGGTI